MIAFLARRLLHAALVVLGVTAIVFVLMRLVGDPVQMMLPLDATPEERDLLRSQLGLDRPVVEQFLAYARGALALDFGDSLWQRRPAMAIVAERLPATALLVALGVGTAFVLALPLGMAAALAPDSVLDRTISGLGVAALSMPQFWLGLLLMLLFGVRLGWLPTSGGGSLAHLALPAATVAIPAVARLALVVRSALRAEMDRPYVVAARARGFGRARVTGVHALRNALAPILTLSGWEVAGAFAGNVIIVETIFAWPGLGLTIVQAIDRMDVVLLQAAAFTVALIVVGINLALDVAHRLIDPRARLG